MSSTLSRPAQFRHVTFADDLEPRGQALNLSPARSRRRDDARPVAAVDVVPMSQDDEAFVGWLMRRSGLTPSDYRPGTMARRLPTCLRTLRVNTVGQARHAIERTPSLASVAINALVIGVTSFFRDPGVFDQLRDHVLPGLMADRRDAPGPLRAWSTGCSDGPELYSLAMTLSELGALPRWQLLGTDCRDAAVRRATAGLYSADEVKSVPPAMLGRYFVPEGSGRRATAALRLAARFRVGNALDQAEPGPFDLILCRNMAIYLHPEAAGRLWQRLQDALRPGGLIVLGKAEAPVGAGKLSPVAPGIFRRSRG